MNVSTFSLTSTESAGDGKSFWLSGFLYPLITRGSNQPKIRPEAKDANCFGEIDLASNSMPVSSDIVLTIIKAVIITKEVTCEMISIRFT